MAQPTTRDEFKDWILRKLGAPVIQINVADEQVDDRIDEAVDFWRDYHYNGSQLVYLKHQITQDDIDNGYVTLPSQLLGISGIFNLNTSISAGSGIFNVQYQFVLNNLEDITGYNITNYYMAMQHMEFLQEMLVGKPMIRYNKHVNKLFIDGSEDAASTYTGGDINMNVRLTSLNGAFNFAQNNANFKQILFFQEALSDSELITLTTI